MNKLSTIVKENYIIVFLDGSKKETDKETGEKILRLSCSAQKTFILDGQLYSFSNIAKLLPIGEYYDQYPDKRPVSTPTFKSEPYRPFSIYEQARKNKHRIESSIKGIKNYINGAIAEGREPTKWSKEHLAKLERLLIDRKAELEAVSPIQSMD
jgi:hypothetical protein